MTKILLTTFIILAAAITTATATPQPAANGKWLVTISRGKGAKASTFLPLRNVLAQIFTSKRGGSFSHIIDLDDLSSEAATKKNYVTEKLQLLAIEIQNFKRSHPEEKTQIIFGLTGHGRTDSSGNFMFALSDEDLSGDELVATIEKLNADNTLLIMQSCQSGLLVTKHFKEAVTRFSQNLKTKKSISVVTPISEKMDSTTKVWENEILKPSFEDENVDTNKDGYVTASEWRNFIVKKSCENLNYVPEMKGFDESQAITKWDTVGLDPHFFDLNTSPDAPLFLTGKGLLRKQRGQITAPVSSQVDQSSIQISSAVQSFCTQQRNLYIQLHKANLPELLALISSTSGIDRLKSVDFLSLNRFDFSPQILNVLSDVLNNEKDPRIKAKAILAFGLQSSSERNNPQVIALLDRLESTFDRQQAVEQLASTQVMSRFTSAKRFGFFMRVLSSNQQADVRKFAAASLGYIQNREAIPSLIAAFQTESDPTARTSMVSALTALNAIEASSILIRSFNSEKDAQVKETLIGFFWKEKTQEAIPLMISISQHDSDDFLRNYAGMFLKMMNEEQTKN